MKPTKCEKAKELLARIRALRSKIDALRGCLEPGRSGCAGERGAYSKDASLLGALNESQRELDRLLDSVRRAVRRMDSPGEALLMELIFLYGLDAGAIASSLSLTHSALYRRIAAATETLEKEL